MREYMKKMLSEDYPKGYFIMYVDSDGIPKLSCNIKDVNNSPLGDYILYLLRLIEYLEDQENEDEPA